MPPAANNPPRPEWAAFLCRFGVLGLLMGSLFFITGGLRAMQGHLQATKWPTAEARVDQCWIHSYHHYRSHAWGTEDQARCALRYQVGGVTYQEVKDAGSSVFSSDQRIVLISPKVTRDKLIRWTSLHPKGSMQTIHYNPANPQQISLAGADDDIQENTGIIQLQIAATLLSVSLVALITSFASRAKNETSTATFASDPPAV
jgi:hypothetical protein